jgi:hypothetical protein
VVALVGRLTWWSPSSRCAPVVAVAVLVADRGGGAGRRVAELVVVAVAGMRAVVADLTLGRGGQEGTTHLRFCTNGCPTRCDP